MEKIIIFGVGKNAEKICVCLKEEIEIVAYVDNNSDIWGKELAGIKIMEPVLIEKEDYQYIIVATISFESVVNQLLDLGIDQKKIITPFAFEHAKYSLWGKIFQIEELIFLEMNTKLESIALYLNNIEYELAAKIKTDKIRFPKILGIQKAVHEISYNGKSMSRYGDGELDIILGRNNSFQTYDEKLAQRLKEILTSNLENHIVCIPDAYGDYENRTEEFKNCFRKHLSDGGREREYQLFDMQKKYYDSFITRPYKDYIDKSEAGKKFELLKSIWKGKDITIVEGNKSRLGVGNDLFAEASSCIRIIAPNKEAFAQYDSLLEGVFKTDKSRLVLIALGATATVLAYDLAKCGYQALDIGHVDIEYEWYLRGVTGMVAIKGKYVNEVPDGRNVSEFCDDEKYNQEIIAKIL